MSLADRLTKLEQADHDRQQGTAPLVVYCRQSATEVPGLRGSELVYGSDEQREALLADLADRYPGGCSPLIVIAGPEHVQRPTEYPTRDPQAR